MQKRKLHSRRVPFHSNDLQERVVQVRVTVISLTSRRRRRTLPRGIGAATKDEKVSKFVIFYPPPGCVCFECVQEQIEERERERRKSIIIIANTHHEVTSKTATTTATAKQAKRTSPSPLTHALRALINTNVKQGIQGVLNNNTYIHTYC